MFFPFTNYKVVDVPQTNNDSLLYTTTATSMMFFVPRGANMESDSPVGIYIKDYFIDTDGQNASPWLFYVYDQDATAGGDDLNSDVVKGGVQVPFNAHEFGQFMNTSMIVPSGKQIRSYVGNSSDRIGGTLYVMELP